VATSIRMHLCSLDNCSKPILSVGFLERQTCKPGQGGCSMLQTDREPDESKHQHGNARGIRTGAELVPSRV
jgi:hypothetical protein